LKAKDMLRCEQNQDYPLATAKSTVDLDFCSRFAFLVAKTAEGKKQQMLVALFTIFW
jgi:hypothetical protein